MWTLSTSSVGAGCFGRLGAPTLSGKRHSFFHLPSSFRRQKRKGMTREELKEREDQLTAYFLHELRKPARD